MTKALSAWLSAEIEENTDPVQIALAGSVDASSASALRRLLRAFSGRSVVLNLAAMTFVDADGLRVLLACRQVSERSGGSLVLECVPEHRRSLIELRGAGSLLEEGATSPGERRRRFANDPGAPAAVRAFVAAELAAEPATVRSRAICAANELAAHAVAHTDADFAVLVRRGADGAVQVELASADGPSSRAPQLGGITRRMLPLSAAAARGPLTPL